MADKTKITFNAKITMDIPGNHADKGMCWIWEKLRYFKTTGWIDADGHMRFYGNQCTVQYDDLKITHTKIKPKSNQILKNHHLKRKIFLNLLFNSTDCKSYGFKVKGEVDGNFFTVLMILKKDGKFPPLVKIMECEFNGTKLTTYGRGSDKMRFSLSDPKCVSKLRSKFLDYLDSVRFHATSMNMHATSNQQPALFLKIKKTYQQQLLNHE